MEGLGEGTGFRRMSRVQDKQHGLGEGAGFRRRRRVHEKEQGLGSWFRRWGRV